MSALAREQIVVKVAADIERHASNAEVKRRQAAGARRPEEFNDVALSVARDEAKVEALSVVYEWLTGENSFDTALAARKHAEEEATLADTIRAVHAGIEP